MSPSGNVARPRGATRGSYFFLSYAHSPPTIEEPTSAPYASVDPSVHAFFRDLVEAVEHRVGPKMGRPAGFIDQDVPPGSDWNATLADALGTAEVFVPLYSPSYFNNPWPLKEHSAFLQRLVVSSMSAPGSRITPVLWIPFPAWDSPPEVQRAVELGEGVPEYRDNGLRALCMLTYYREQYRAIVDRLAARIVDAAQGPVLAPDPSLVLERVPERHTEPAFVAAVLAPTRKAGSPARASVYGDTSSAWRPFAAQVLPAADYVASTAERLGLLPARIADFADSAELFKKHPAVLLIDPMILDSPDGKQLLLGVANSLLPWVRPLVVSGESTRDFARAERLAEEAVTMLTGARVANPERVNQLQEFVSIMPTLVTEARRQFLKHGHVWEPSGDPEPRRRLTDPDNSPPTSTGTINDE